MYLKTIIDGFGQADVLGLTLRVILSGNSMYSKLSILWGFFKNNT